MVKSHGGERPVKRPGVGSGQVGARKASESEPFDEVSKHWGVRKLVTASSANKRGRSESAD